MCHSGVGVRKYGTDFAAIAEVIGNKTASHVRNFFITYRQQFHLDDVLHDTQHNPSSVRNTKIVKDSSTEPPEVSKLFYCSRSTVMCHHGTHSLLWHQSSNADLSFCWPFTHHVKTAKLINTKFWMLCVHFSDASIHKAYIKSAAEL